jgi:hypothetical protein
MTRDFNNQRRDDMRPSSREQSSSRNGDERSPRPARPRLNRESVDRAWESGAPAQHADYRTRGNNGNRGQAPRNNWNGNSQNGQGRQGGQYPARNNRPSYGDRPAGPRRFDGPANGNQRPPSRPFDANSTNSTNRRYENNRPDSAPAPHGPYGPRTPHTNGPRPEYRDQSRPYEPRPSYRDNGQRDGFQRRNTNYSDRPNYSDRSNQSDRSDRFERGPRPFDRNNRGDANQYGGHPTRSFDRDTRAPGNNYRDNRPPRSAERPETQDTQHPRWQSRPFAQRDSANRREQNDFQQSERFKGDYERFNSPEEKPRFAGRPSHKYDAGKPRRYESNKPKPEKKEPHVTPLPDGRVLKGPRPVQRKNAEFWTDIAQNTDELLDGVKEVTTPNEQVSASQEQPTTDSVIAQELLTHDNDVAQEQSVNNGVVAQELLTHDNDAAQEASTDDSIAAQASLTHDNPVVQEQEVAEEGTLSTAAKPRKRAATAASRSKKASEKQKGTQPKTSGPVPRPSRRGFKWPTPE